ncbi:cation-dependent mannose-6-phosphate receptor-like [Scylla paramamosain]|uniref:cation-dependent mannose-6-phosphate receptor-like n=1 Tax=Scylla paramamosain TaxID=85552 RepID=UPI003082E4D6
MCVPGMRVVGVVLAVTCLGSNQALTLTPPCLLKFDNGSSINLMMVAAAPMDAPRFIDVTAENKLDHSKYSYNPCYSYVYPPDGEAMACSKDVAVCQASKYGYSNVGTQSSATFHYHNETGRWMIIYKNYNGNRLTNVFLQCSNNTVDSLHVWGETEKKSMYNMTLISRCACIDGCGYPILPRGMSLGSFLLLLLLLAIFIYLLVGYVYRRFVIGARGIELFPHLSFWRDFPYLVQDGFFFLIKCGQDDLTYERI